MGVWNCRRSALDFIIMTEEPDVLVLHKFWVNNRVHCYEMQNRVRRESLTLCLRTERMLNFTTFYSCLLSSTQELCESMYMRTSKIQFPQLLY
jgi:hypothetical protein